MTTDHYKNYKFITTVLRSDFASACVDEFTSAQPDWAHLSENLMREGVFYPFYRNLMVADKEEVVPKEIASSAFGLLAMTDRKTKEFSQTYYLHLAESAKFSHQIDQTLSRLDALKIKMLIFKGPAVDSFIYDGFFRPRLDMDILFSDKDMPAAEKALSGLGYFSEKGPGIDAVTARLNSKVFRHEDEGLMPLHVHWRLINNTFLTADGALRMNMERVWQETELFKDNHFIHNLKPELNILYLCEHALKHDFDQLIYLYEIERLIGHYGGRFDWNKFVGLAREFGMERIVYYGLYLAREVLSGNIPDEVISAFKPDRLSIGEKIFIKNVLRNKTRRYSSYFVYLAARKGLLRKAYLSFRMIFPSGH